MAESFEEYCALVAKSRTLSSVKKTILHTLWGTQSTLQSNWIRSSDLLKLTGQKYFDRRARELRDHNGCDIETKVIGGEHQWRLASINLASGNIREYLSASQKNELFEEANNKCAVCGRTALPGVRGLQADHRVPLIRGGSHALNNWQALCNECNVVKRRACADCDLKCESCSWAFPSSAGMPITLRVPPDLFDKIDNKMKSEPTFVEKVFTSYFDKK